MKRSRLEQLGDFIVGKGFYIVLFLCVAAIGISGYYLMSSTGQSQQPTEPVTANPQIVLPDSSANNPTGGLDEAQQSAAPQPKEEPQPQPLPEDPEPVAEPVPEEPQPKAVVYTWPVKGQVLRPFSIETLSYDATMGDWRTHTGVDIAAEVGWDVLAAGEGQVVEVAQDAMMGTTVVVQQPDGVVTTYANLAPEVPVAVGDAVDTGTVVGQVGETAMAESHMEPHLHLEMVANGEQVDPLLYLPQQ